MNSQQNLGLITRALSVFWLSVLGSYLLIQNISLFGTTIILNEKNISDLSPRSRVNKILTSDAEIQEQIGDLVYFTTKSAGYDTAKIKFTFKPTNPNQEIYLGFKDAPDWHYQIKPIYLPLIEKLTWQKTGFGLPIFFQKKSEFNSFSDFVDNPPPDKVVGTYFLQNDYGIDVLKEETGGSVNITLPLRGSHTFYTFLHNQPFNLKIAKQDLNWYPGEDKLVINIYHHGQLLDQRTISDDGITAASKKSLPDQNIDISSPNPQNGLYKVEIIADNDTIIKSIAANFGKIVFASPIFPVGNNPLYNLNTDTQWNNKIYTDANYLVFKTAHKVSLQPITINNDVLEIDEINQDFSYSTSGYQNEITITQADLVIGGAGYFAFAKEHFFTPYPYNRYEIKSAEDLGRVDYLLTDYIQPFNLDGGWKETELTIDLTAAYYEGDVLSWVIKAPQLKKNQGSIQIKNIEVALEKKALIKN